MNLDTDHTPSYEDPIPFACKPIRRLRVRHSYPESVIELVGHLRIRMRAREIAAALDIPVSSIYRWAPISNPPAMTTDDAGNHVTDWKPLISRCRADGLNVSQSIAEALLCNPPKRAANNVRKLNSPEIVSKEPPNLQAARSMIERSYFQNIDFRVLAAAAGLSRFSFIHAFTRTYDIPPHQYLLRTRIDAAKRLLATSRETIDVIAAATGFRSGACLNRAFARVEGHCISRYCRVIDAAV